MNEWISDLAQHHHKYTPRSTLPPKTTQPHACLHHWRQMHVMNDTWSLGALGHIACNPPIWHALALGGATVCPIWATITSAGLPIALGTACTTAVLWDEAEDFYREDGFSRKWNQQTSSSDVSFSKSKLLLLSLSLLVFVHSVPAPAN